ncbi:MAG: V-type ATP synthase subunit F [Candidatus Odinarchaeota archaeon]|nr:V-type ATP synthase subunit F [Candidatus Odinarchaeota archaeon]
MEIAVVGDEATVTGFRLCGIKMGYVPEDEDTLRKILDVLSRMDEVGMIVITDEYAFKVREEIVRIMREKKKIIITLPTTEKGMEVRKELIDRMINTAIGMRLERE